MSCVVYASKKMSDGRCMFCLGPCDNQTLLSPVCKCPALYHDYCGTQWYKSYVDTCPICRKVVAGGKPSVRVVPVTMNKKKVAFKESSPLKVSNVQRAPMRPSAPPAEQFVSIEEYVVIESVPAPAVVAPVVAPRQPTNVEKMMKMWCALTCIVLILVGGYMIIHNLSS